MLSISKIQENYAVYLPANSVPVEDEKISDLGLHSLGLPYSANEAAFLNSVSNKNLFQ